MEGMRIRGWNQIAWKYPSRNLKLDIKRMVGNEIQRVDRNLVRKLC